MDEVLFAKIDGILDELRSGGAKGFRYCSPAFEMQVEFATTGMPVVETLTAATPDRAPVLHVATAPGLGYVQLTQAGTDRVLCKPGQSVTEGEVVALVVFESIFLPVKAPASGAVGSIHVVAGQRVGFGDPIVTIESP